MSFGAILLAMRNLTACFILILSTAILSSQSSHDAPKPDLSKFTSEQLRACFKDEKICGTREEMAISSELFSRIPSMPSDQLISCFGNWRICGTGDDQASGWPISDELARRGNPHELLVRYWTEPDVEIRNGIVHVVYHFHTAEVRRR